MVHFGEIIEVSDYSARVRDLETGAETDWLCVLYPLVGTNRIHWPAPALGTRVGYVEQGETGGVILGGIYDAANESTGNADAVTISLFGFDVTIKSTGIEAGATTEPTVKGNALKTVITSFLNAIIAHTHATAGTGVPSVPVNVLDFSNLLTQLDSFLATKVKVE